MINSPTKVTMRVRTIGIPETRERRRYANRAVVPPHALLDSFKRAMKLATDYDLSLELGCEPSYISRLRGRTQPINDRIILAIHCACPEQFPIARIKQLRDLDQVVVPRKATDMRPAVKFRPIQERALA